MLSFVFVARTDRTHVDGEIQEHIGPFETVQSALTWRDEWVPSGVVVSTTQDQVLNTSPESYIKKLF